MKPRLICSANFGYMRGARLAAALEAELDIPILDSVALTLWGSLHRCAIDTGDLSSFGRVFDLDPDWRPIA